jgi:hypothetical protein
MELSLALRKGYFAKINGQIMNGVDTVPVYDIFAIPEETTYPYILLSSQTSTQRINKGNKIYNATMLIDIVTGDLNPIGREQSETIADQIELLVNPLDRSDIDITAHGYEIGDTYREDDSDLGAKNDQYYILRKLMRYRHIITKL